MTALLPSLNLGGMTDAKRAGEADVKHKYTIADRNFHLEFGMRLALVRRLKHIRQDQLAKSVGLSRESITNIENGKQGISLLLAIRLATGVGVRLTKLLPAYIPDQS